jgi:predicted lipid-binding transport protein (Tim44 family)
MQRDMPARTAPDATPAKPAAACATSRTGHAGAAPMAGAAAPKRNWMGPLAGLAAGLGIAALMSHLGMGEAMGNFLMLALLAVAAWPCGFLLMRKFGANQRHQPCRPAPQHGHGPPHASRLAHCNSGGDTCTRASPHLAGPAAPPSAAEPSFAQLQPAAPARSTHRGQGLCASSV